MLVPQHEFSQNIPEIRRVFRKKRFLRSAVRFVLRRLRLMQGLCPPVLKPAVLGFEGRCRRSLFSFRLRIRKHPEQRRIVNVAVHRRSLLRWGIGEFFYNLLPFAAALPLFFVSPCFFAPSGLLGFLSLCTLFTPERVGIAVFRYGLRRIRGILRSRLGLRSHCFCGYLTLLLIDLHRGSICSVRRPLGSRSFDSLIPVKQIWFELAHRQSLIVPCRLLSGVAVPVP